MELTTLKFHVDTKELEGVITVLDRVATSVKNLNQVQKSTEANQKKQAKSTEEAAKAAEKLTDATENLNNSSSKSEKLLERLKNTHSDLVNGMTRGESSILNQARALGVADNALGPYIEQLKLIKSLTKDPFDQSIGAIRSVQSEYDNLQQRASLASKGIALTNKQLDEYSRISSEIKGKIIQMGIDPKSVEGQARFNSELQKTQAEYLGIVKRVNDLTTSEKQLTEALRESENIAKSIRQQGWKEYASSIGQSTDEIKELNQWYIQLEKESDKVVAANDKITASIERTNKIVQLVKSGMSEREAGQRVDLASQGIDESQINRLIAAENSLIATRQKGIGVDREKLNAVKYLAREDEKLEVIIRELDRAEKERLGGNQNANALNERRSRSLANYERNLRLAGVSAVESARKLEQFRTIQDKIAKAEEARSIQYLRRGLQPQIGDIAVSLASGQNPLTVMLQQGDQIRGLIEQTDVQGEALQKAFRDAMTGTVESIKITAGAMINLLGGAFTTTMGIFKSGIAGTVIALGALAVAFFKTQAQQDELSKSLILTGANLGLSTSGALTLAKSMETVGVSTSKSIDIITAFAKEGAGNMQQMQSIIPAVAEAMKHLGLSADDMAKEYKKISKDPVAALTELGIKTGLVTAETVNMVNALVQSGERTKAVAAAIEAANKVYLTAATDMQREYSLLGEIINATGNYFKNLWDGIKSLTYKDSAAEKLKKEYEEVNARIVEVKENLKSNASIGIKGDPALLNQLTAQSEALREQLNLFEKARQAEANNRAEVSAKNKANEVALDINKQLADDADKMLSKQLKLNEYIDWYVKKKKEDANQKAQGAGDLLNLEALKEAARLEWERGKAAKESRRELKNINTEYESDLKKLNDLRESAIGKTFQLTKAEVEYNKILSSPVYKKYTQEQKNALEIAKESAVIYEKANVVLKESQKLKEEYNKQDIARANIQEKYSNNQTKELQNLETQNKELEFRNSLIGKNADDAARMTVEYQKQVKITQADNDYLLERKKIQEDFEESFKRTGRFDIVGYVNALDEAMRIRTQKEINASKEAAVATAEIYSKEFERVSNGITDAITTALFEGGKAGKKKLRDVIVAELKKPITIYVQAFIKDIMGGQGGSISNLLSSSGSSGGFLNNLAGMLGSNSSLGKMLGSLSSTIGIFGSAYSGGAALAMNGLGLQSMQGAFTSIGAGNVAQGAGQAAGTAAPYMMAYSIGKMAGQAISGGYSAVGGSSGNTAVNVGAAVGTIFGPIGTAIGTAVGGLVNRAFGRKLESTGIEGTFSSSGFTGNQFKFEKGGWFRSDKTTTSALDSATQSSLNDTFLNIKNGTKVLAESLGLGSSAIENFAYSMKLNLKDLTDEQVTQKIEEEFNKITESLSSAVLGTTAYSKSGETSFQTLTRLSQVLEFTNGMFADLGWTLYQTSLSGADSAEQFLKLFGGMEQATSALNSYYQNFYSEQERLASTNEKLTKQFEKLGIAMPTDKLAYRALVEKAMVEGNDELVVSLVNMSSVFAQLHPEIVETTDDIESISETLKSLREESANLNIELLRAQGNTEAANAAFRELSTAGMTQMEIALWDSNRAIEKQIADLNTKSSLEKQLLQVQGNTAKLRELELQAMSPANQELQKLIWSIEDAADASNALSQAEQARASQRYSLETQLLNLQGDTAKLRERELALIDPSNQELQKLIWSLQDQSKATEDASRAAAELAAEQEKIASQRYSLETQLLNLQGNTAELRARELALLDPSNRALQELIWNLQDQAEAADLAAKAAADLAAEQSRIASERYSLETQLLQLQGNTAKLRERELALIDPSNRALQEQIWAQEAANAAAEASAKAAAEAAEEAARAQADAVRAAEELKAAWQSVTDSIFEEVNRIRNLAGGDSVMSLAVAQRNFDAANAAAKSGDQEAAKTLPELSQKLLELATLQASSTAELRRFQLLTAAALESTGSTLVGQYGLVVPAFAEGGNYSGGMALVGEDGPELINFNKSARIHSASDTASILNNGSAIALLERLNDNIENLRYEVRADVQHNAKTAKLLDRVIKDGENVSVVFDTAQPVTVV